MGLTYPEISGILEDMTTTQTTTRDRISTARGAELGTYHILVDGEIAATIQGAATLAHTLRVLAARLIAEGAN